MQKRIRKEDLTLCWAVFTRTEDGYGARCETFGTFADLCEAAANAPRFARYMHIKQHGRTLGTWRLPKDPKTQRVARVN